MLNIRVSHLQLAIGISKLDIDIAKQNKSVVLQILNLICRNSGLLKNKNYSKTEKFPFWKVSVSNSQPKNTNFFNY